MASPTMNENAPAKLVPIHLSSRSPPQTFVLCTGTGRRPDETEKACPLHGRLQKV